MIYVTLLVFYLTTFAVTTLLCSPLSLLSLLFKNKTCLIFFLVELLVKIKWATLVHAFSCS